MTQIDPFKQDLVQLLPRMRRFALSLTRQLADGDDLVQAACERAIRNRAQWQTGSRLDSWVYTMMRNLWMSELRSRKVRFGQGQVDAQVDAQENDAVAVGAGAHDQLYGNQLLQMILSMPDGLSSTLLLVTVEGHSYQETADILGIPIGTVMSRVSKARQVMKEKLAAAGGMAVQ